MFTVFGVAYSFGEFFGPMADEFGTDRSETALFFALTTFAYFALGIVTGRIADRHGPRRVVAFGATAMTIGLLLTAEVESIQLGATDYRQKPLDPSRVRSAVSEALARRHGNARKEVLRWSPQTRAS